MEHIWGLESGLAILTTLSSAVAVDGGPTEEQQRFLDAIGRHVLGVSDRPPPIPAEEAAATLWAPEARRVAAEGLIVLELMCHPASPALVANVERYLEALGTDHAEQAVVRSSVAEAREQVAEDWARVHEPTPDEPGLDGASDDDVARQLQSLGECAPGTLGRSFYDFYDRNGFALPVDHQSLITHDFAHVLAGYEPTPEGEIALQAMLVAAARGEHHFSGLLAALLLFEVGIMPFPDIEPKVAVLDRPGAAELFARGIHRGADTTGDFQRLDHFALASRDLVGLRAELGIPAPMDGPSTFVV